MSQSDRIAEKNARAGARGVYLRWLAERFGTLDLMLTHKGEDRVSLRRIYVPVRVDTKDRADESLGGPDQVQQETLPGEDALALIARSEFVAISGRPGSGKTTLVQALLGELTRDDPSPVRDQLAGTRGILPVPLLLRDYQDQLEQMRTLDDLLELWWSHVEREARGTGHRLDVPRLRASYAPDGDDMPLLVLFDGVDEVGGAGTRQRIVDIAAGRCAEVCCAVVTGRPAGFADLTIRSFPVGKRSQPGLFDDVPLQVHHLQPFALPQIQAFIDRFLRLRQEYQKEARLLREEFDTALADPRRPHLLNLARRPIFLTLMALVHVNERRMPHGRADLYARIVDLYLNRQMQQKRLTHTLNNEPMPHWDQREVRRALGYLAWRSQHQGAKRYEARQFIWGREELEAELRALLAGETEDRRPFSDLKPTDATALLDYYLHPAGLLVDPAEGRYQFAHLSFQEFLCAEYIHGRAKARGSRRFLEGIGELLHPHLGQPGWDEVGLLLLCIHAAEGAQTDPDAHLELLANLDPAELPQAHLLLLALTGQELDFSDDERLRWLPLAVAAALVHPDADVSQSLGRVPGWPGPGLDLLRALFETDAPFDLLRERLRRTPPAARFGGDDPLRMLDSAEARWRALDDALDWKEPLDGDAVRDYALVALASDSAWIPKDPKAPEERPLDDAALGQAIAAWLERLLAHAPADGVTGRLTRRVADPDAGPCLPVVMPVADCLDALVMPDGPLWDVLAPRMPLDLWLLQGEALLALLPYVSQPVVFSPSIHGGLRWTRFLCSP